MHHGNAPKGSEMVSIAVKQDGMVRAAVAVPIFRYRGEWRLLLIRRAETLTHHRGQYAFPGGRWEASDKSLWHTARREAEEELGWDQAEMRLLAVLPFQITATSGFYMQPFLVQMPWPLLARPQPAEVAGVIAPPITFFAAHHHQASVQPGGPCYSYRTHTIWGATARVIHGLMAVLGGRLQ